MKDLYEKLAQHPDRQMRFIAPDGSLVARAFSQVHADVVRVMAQLRDCGVGPGDLVAIMGPNSYDWVVADLALLGLQCVCTALPVDGRGEPVDTGSLVTRYQLSALLISRSVPVSGELSPAAAWLGDEPLSLRPRVAAGRPALPADVFSIAFSSGTAGTRKGLMMSGDGVMNTIRVSGQAWRVTRDDNILIVMPFSNFQQRYLMYLAIWAGADAAVVPPERMFQKLRVLEPTIILGPPSFFELADNRIRAAGARDKLPYYAAAALHAVLPGRASRAVRSRLGRKWTSMYGSRVRLMLTGSAPVPPRTIRLFHQLGAPLFEVYGSTEIGWISFNLPQRHRTGTAGRPVDGVDVSVVGDGDGDGDGNGEILVTTKTPQALGYVFEGADSQPSVFLADGAIATGDIGRFGRSGFLQLTGRKKNVIITRSGVKISPEALERDIERACPVRKAVVVAAGQGGLMACVVWLDAWQSAERTGEIESFIAGSNQKRDPAHKIARVIFRPAAELTVESGLLTRNFKMDRNAVMRKVFAETEGGLWARDKLPTT